MKDEVLSSYIDGEHRIALMTFIEQADLSVTQVELCLEHVTALCENLRSFFGEGPESSIGQIMELVSEFLTGFSTAKDVLKKSILAEKRKRQRK